MVKYCIHCGKQNDDGAVFCTACGLKFADQGTPSTAKDSAEAPGALSHPNSPAQVLAFGLSHGDHKFVLGSVDFMDESGSVIYSASRESVLHENYTIVQGEVKIAYMKHKLHLNAYSFELQNGSGAPMGEVRCQYTGRKGQLPTYSYTDPQGDSRAALVWEQGTLRFAICDPNSAQVFAQASAELPGGVKGDLKALIHTQHRISIAAGTPLPLAVILAFCVTVANMPPL